MKVRTVTVFLPTEAEVGADAPTGEEWEACVAKMEAGVRAGAAIADRVRSALVELGLEVQTIRLATSWAALLETVDRELALAAAKRVDAAAEGGWVCTPRAGPQPLTASRSQRRTSLSLLSVRSAPPAPSWSWT